MVAVIGGRDHDGVEVLTVEQCGGIGVARWHVPCRGKRSCGGGITTTHCSHLGAGVVIERRQVHGVGPPARTEHTNVHSLHRAEL